MRTHGWSVGRAAWVAALSSLLGTPGLATGQEGRPCGRAPSAIERDGIDWFPSGTLFCPLLADRRETVSQLGAVDFESPWVNTTVALTGIGDHIPFMRLPLGSPEDGMEVAISAAVVALFDLDVRSFDFLHADFMVGLPVSFRWQAWSGRVRLYHWSSHLGDEFLLREPQPVAREEISLEALEVILARQLGALRVFGGGEWWLDRVPAELPGALLVLGAELRPARGVDLGDRLTARGVAGVHMRWSSVETGPSASLRAGIELGKTRPGNAPERRYGLVFEWFDGNSPYGQFYRDPLRFVGISLYWN